jgi:hypothetical protein
MAQPGRSAQAKQRTSMRTAHQQRATIYSTLLVYLSAGPLLSAACSAGESGLVLGAPLPAVEGGNGGTGGSSGTAGAGGSEPLGPAGAAGLTGNDTAGAAGAGDSGDPTWIQDACTPALTFENRDTTAQGQLFNDAVPDPSRPVWEAAHAACRLLYRNAGEVKPIAQLSLIVEDYDGIAGTSGTTLRLSTRYLKDAADRGLDLRQEITGILHFATSLVYQNTGSESDPAPPNWLVVGIADYVRLESGYIARNERAKGGSYDSSGSQTTAFFLDYLAAQEPTLVMQLNQQLAPAAPAWSNDVFQTLLGSDIDTLWASYQATL